MPILIAKILQSRYPNLAIPQTIAQGCIDECFTLDFAFTLMEQWEGSGDAS